MTGKDDRYEIVGIVEDGKYDSLTERPLTCVFYPVARATNSRTILVLRSQQPPADAARALNSIITGIDPALPISIATWPTSLSLVLFPRARGRGFARHHGLAGGDARHYRNLRRGCL